MAGCGPNLQTSRVLFSFLKWRNYFFGTVNGKEKHQGVQSSQTFLVRNFSFLQPPRKHDRFFSLWVSPSFSHVFSIVFSYNKRKEILLYSVSFGLLK